MLFSEEISLEEVLLEPTRRTIFVGDRHFFLSFPKMKFKIGFSKNNNLFVYHKLIIETFIDGKYYKFTILPNMHTSGSMCLQINHRFKTVQELVSYVIEQFWSSRFSSVDSMNFDFEAVLYFLENIKSNFGFNEYFELWEKKTKENPRWVPGSDFFKNIERN
jgi:hypothetical protein